MPKLLKRTLIALFLILLSPFIFIGVMALSNGRVGVSSDFRTSAILASPPAPLSAPLTLKVVTFNIQDLALVSDERPRRDGGAVGPGARQGRGDDRRGRPRRVGGCRSRP